MTLTTIRRASALLFCALATTVHGEPLTAKQAVSHALRHNPTLAAARAQANAADESREAAEAARLPQINASYGARRSDNPLDAFADKLNTRVVTSADFAPDRLNNPGWSTLHATELSATWPLYTGGRIEAAAREAAEHASAAQSGWQRAREATAYRTLAAYYGAQAAAHGETIAADAVQAAQNHANTTARLLRERRIVASDSLTAEVNLSMMQSAREQARSRSVHGRNTLKLAMGMALETPLELPAWDDHAPGPAPAALEEHERRALENRTDLKAQQAAVRAAREKIEQARAGYRPQVGISASESWYDDKPGFDNSSTRVMGVVSMNLYRGGRDRHEVASAVAAAEEQEKRLEALHQQVRAEVRSAHQAVLEARARVEICADNVGKAARTVDLVRGRYGEGRTILIDLLQAERALIEARREKLDATHHHAVAEAALGLATGALELPE